MGVVAVSERLALLLPQIDARAKLAYVDPPNSISPNAGPCWVTVPGPEHKDYTVAGRAAAYILDSQGAYLSLRTYKVMLFIGTLGSGGPGEMVAKCKLALDGFGPFFLGRPMLSDPLHELGELAGIWETNPGEDTGVTGVEWAGQTYVGVIFDLTVTELIVYDIVAHE